MAVAQHLGKRVCAVFLCQSHFSGSWTSQCDSSAPYKRSQLTLLGGLKERVKMAENISKRKAWILIISALILLLSFASKFDNGSSIRNTFGLLTIIIFNVNLSRLPSFLPFSVLLPTLRTQKVGGSIVVCSTSCTAGCMWVHLNVCYVKSSSLINPLKYCLL